MTFQWTDRDDTETQLIHAWQLPAWATVLILLAILLFAAFIYRFETGNKSSLLRIALFSLRASLIGLTLWMLAAFAFQPYRSERPELVLVVDSSQSMQTVTPGTDSRNSLSRFETLRSELLSNNAAVITELSSKYQLKLMVAGQQAQSLSNDSANFVKSLSEINADQPVSRLGASLQQTLELQRGRPTSAVVFLSDGINTEGITLTDAAPFYRSADLPVFAIGVGSDQAEPDIQLTDVLAESVAFVGDTIQLPYNLRLTEVSANAVKVQVRNLDSGVVLAEQSLPIKPNQEQASGTLTFSAEQPGTMRLSIEVIPVAGEKATENNNLQRTLEIRDQAINVLLVQQLPSYEFRFLKSLLERARQPSSPDKPTFNLTSVLLDGDPRYADQDKSAERLLPVSYEQLKQFDVIILGDVNANQIGLATLQSIERVINQQGSGLMLIAADTTTFQSLANSPLQRLLPLDANVSEKNNDPSIGNESAFRWNITPLGLTAPPLQLDSETVRNTSIWQQLPESQSFAPLGKPKAGSLVWATYPGRAGSDVMPLLIAQYFGKGRVIVQATDETFQWTSHFGDDLYYQRYWNQLIRWLARGKLSGSNTAKLSFDRAEYLAGESVGLSLKFQGSVPLREAESAEVVLQREGGQRQVVALERQGNEGGLYRTNIPNLPVGRYRAVVTKPILQPPPAAELVIAPALNELSKTRVDWGAMKNLAEATRGKFLPLDQWDQLPKLLPEGKTIRLQPLAIIPIWNHWIVLGLFIALITAEWLLRRYARML